MYNILICDDEPDIVSALKIYLTGDEYQLFEAYNGRQALKPWTTMRSIWYCWTS